MGDASLSESPEEEDNDSPGPNGGDSSPQNVHQEPLSPSANDWLGGSPRKRTQTLPAFNCPLPGMTAKAEALNRWSRIQEGVEEKSATLSEDIFRILDLQRSSLFSSPPAPAKVPEDRAVAQRGSEITGSSSTAGSSKYGGDSQPSQVAVVTPPLLSVQAPAASGLGQQINSRTEKKEEQQQLQLVESLQRENKELRATVAELHSALESERSRVAALEICLRNAERSRDEAQRRNQELQTEIQQFLTRGPQAPT